MRQLVVSVLVQRELGTRLAAAETKELEDLKLERARQAQAARELAKQRAELEARAKSMGDNAGGRVTLTPGAGGKGGKTGGWTGTQWPDDNGGRSKKQAKKDEYWERVRSAQGKKKGGHK